MSKGLNTKPLLYYIQTSYTKGLITKYGAYLEKMSDENKDMLMEEFFNSRDRVAYKGDISIDEKLALIAYLANSLRS